ncbi:MAG: TSUP family transporter, partial [Acidimicrobiales bacterium]
MSVWGDLAVAGAGVLAGGINTIVGSGSLITFPTLVALGLPPLVANVTNTVGLVPGSVSGAWGYRRERAGQRGRAIRLGIFSALGGLAGGILLLSLPGSFQEVVPWL